MLSIRACLEDSSTNGGLSMICLGFVAEIPSQKLMSNHSLFLRIGGHIVFPQCSYSLFLVSVLSLLMENL